MLHADDFGMNSAVNSGIVQAFEDGLLTSASILSNAPATLEALSAAGRLADASREGTLLSHARRAQLADPALPFDFGVHVNLTQGRPLTRSYPAALLDADGFFPSIAALFVRLLAAPRRWQTPISQELAAQVALVCDHGLRPTHLNGHQYIELLPAVSDPLQNLLHRFAIPVVRVAAERGLWTSTRIAGLGWGQRALAAVKRWYGVRFGRRMRAAGVSFPDGFFGTAHAGCIDQVVLGSFLQSAAGCRVAEIAWHPGRRPADHPCHIAGWADPLERHRPAELALLTSPLLAETLAAGGFALGRLSTLGGDVAARHLAA
ncbi:MAG TPA: ChbG/HpnK family deacetylase [Pirellulales bacterium]